MRKGNGTEISVPYEGSFLISYIATHFKFSFKKNSTTNLNSASLAFCADRISRNIPDGDKHTDNLTFNLDSDSACINTRDVVC